MRYLELICRPSISRNTWKMKSSQKLIESIREGFVVVNLEREFKQCIRAPWTNALIIKVFGRSVGFNFLNSKIHALWKPTSKLDYVDLGCEFYLICFSVR